LGRVRVDVTKAGMVPEGIHDAQVTGCKYQIKTGEKWNKDGTKTVEFPEWDAASDSPRRTQMVVHVAGSGNMFYDLYDQENCAFMFNNFLKACGVEFDENGYDLEETVGSHIKVEVGYSTNADGSVNAERTEIKRVLGA